MEQCRLCRVHVLLELHLLSFFFCYCLCRRTQTLHMDGADCSGNRVVTLGGAVVYSHSSYTTNKPYPDNVECQLTFKAATERWKLTMRVTDLDIGDMTDSGVCNDALYVFNGEGIMSKNMKAAGGSVGLCGSKLPLLLNSTGPFLTVYFRSDSKGLPGKGFKFVITSYTNGACGSNFQCHNKQCIDPDLKCDKVAHCLDDSDELVNTAPFCPAPAAADNEWLLSRLYSLGVTAAVATTVGTVVVSIVCLVCTVYCCCRCRRHRHKRRDAMRAPTTATSVTINNTAPLMTHITGSTPCSHHSYTQHGYYVVQQPFCASMPANGGVHTSCSVYSATATGKDLSCAYSHHSSMQVPPPPNGARGGGEGYVMAGGSSGYGDASSGSIMLVCRQDQAGRYSPTSSRSERSLYQQQQPAGGHWNSDCQAGALAMTKVPHPVRYDKYGPPSRL